MAQTSTTLISSKAHITTITGSDISFTATSGVNTIKSTSTVLSGSGKLAVRDLITVTNSANNNSTFTVKSIVSTLEITVEQIVTAENSDGSTSVSLDHTGFVSDKAKGDGYYSQPDGVHTVAYQVSADFNANATIKIQGSLATAPAEDDWFDVSGTTFTADTSTVTSSANFTGNFVWVRSKVQSVTAGTVNSILFNN